MSEEIKKEETRNVSKNKDEQGEYMVKEPVAKRCGIARRW